MTGQERMMTGIQLTLLFDLLISLFSPLTPAFRLYQKIFKVKVTNK